MLCSSSSSSNTGSISSRRRSSSNCNNDGGSCSSSISSRASSCTVLVDNHVRTGKLGKKRNSCRIYYGILFEDVLLEGQEGDGRTMWTWYWKLCCSKWRWMKLVYTPLRQQISFIYHTFWSSHHSADTDGRGTSTNGLEIVVGKVALTLFSELSVHQHYANERNKVISWSLYLVEGSRLEPGSSRIKPESAYHSAGANGSLVFLMLLLWDL